MQGFCAAHGTFFLHPLLACCLIYMHGRDCRDELRVRGTGYGILALLLPRNSYFPLQVTHLERGLYGLDSYRIVIEQRLEWRSWGYCHLSSDTPR